MRQSILLSDILTAGAFLINIFFPFVVKGFLHENCRNRYLNFF
uniref:Uncharacterized protein n=1 Tax=Kuenenia stuttgartiensis TaxID=174633 RepID=Q1Q523_KUEST|nr:unknown protein [Candidatus Kuenenia stuttgartiensis]